MAYPPQYIAMVVGAVRTLVGTENMHLRDAITRVARQMNLDAALVDSWVKQSPESVSYTHLTLPTILLV